MNFFDHPLLLGTPIGLLSAWLAWLGYQRSKRADAVAAKRGEVGEIYSGFGLILDNLQEDNKILRDSFAQIKALLVQAEERGTLLSNRIESLRTRVKRLESYIKNHGLRIPNNNQLPTHQPEAG
jgi:hypothetical protein